MAAKQTRNRTDRPNPDHPDTDRPHHALFERLGVRAAAAADTQIFIYSVKIVCGRQSEGHCCCPAGTRPGVYATEVNIQNISLSPAPVVKALMPLINMGAVVGREPDFTELADAKLDVITLPPLAATMDDCCRITELQLGAPANGDTQLTVAILTIVSLAELTVSAVYTATPLNGDGISIDVEYILPRRLGRGNPG
ncbi:MAG: hypothetical protein AB7F74_04260 [Parvibaculaceae bacterium]